MYSYPFLVRLGGLAFYGANRMEMFRLSANYVDRILHGEKAGDLPVEQPTKYEFIINLKTAKALGLNIPRSSLQRRRSDRIGLFAAALLSSWHERAD